ncbi:hypothetical protein VP01_3576g4 [Puccinia sorghi]|uniref:Uncharacterized protein n=1 Tax=Puccinia sorghi TaxID=27349 RepID=A0A0L6UW35_9BASI|nr:hypothetical protein VP01_3576g4 [Puccinia sorghi]
MAKQTPSKLVEELLPTPYHQYLGMFQKSASQGLPPIFGTTSSLS